MVRQFFAIIAALVLAGPVASETDRPVMIGGEAGLDACGGYGRVTGLDPNGDGFLAVRKGPGTNHAMIDKLPMRQPLWLCDLAGNWIGVVYSVSEGRDCEVSSPVAARSPYEGPCQFGWVFSRYVELIAG